MSDDPLVRAGCEFVALVPRELGRPVKLRVENGVLLLDTEFGGPWIVPNIPAAGGVLPQ